MSYTPKHAAEQYCPRHMIGQDVPFQRIRRITGYLVGDINKFNNAKRSEVKDRRYNNV